MLTWKAPGNDREACGEAKLPNTTRARGMRWGQRPTSRKKPGVWLQLRNYYRIKYKIQDVCMSQL